MAIFWALSILFFASCFVDADLLFSYAARKLPPRKIGEFLHIYDKTFNFLFSYNVKKLRVY